MESRQFKYAQLFICIRILTYLLFCDYIKSRDRRGPQQTEGIMRTLQVTESLTESGAQASPSSFAGVDGPSLSWFVCISFSDTALSACSCA